MYQRDFLAYLDFSGGQEDALKATTLARWITHLASDTKMSPNTINRMVSAVKRIMKEAAQQGFISFELALTFKHVDGVKVSALKERTKTTNRTRITPEQMRELVDMPDTSTLVGIRDYALLLTLASSGLRVSELASLTQAQIITTTSNKTYNRKAYLLRVMGKNDTEYREAHLSAKAHDAIETWLEERQTISPYIFTGFSGRGDSRATHEPMSEQAIGQLLTKYAHQAGMSDVKPHDFRRFVGTQLAKDDIRKAQKALGHKDIRTTAKHYVLDEIEAGLTDDLF